MTTPGCEEIAFFGRTSVDGWFQSLGKALSVFGLVLSVCLIGFSIYAVIHRFGDGIRAGFKRPKKQRPQVEIGLLVLSMGLIAFSIVVVEYLIKANKLTGLSEIDAVGQLIPLLIGTLGCASISWKILANRLLSTKRCWFLFGKHL